MIDSSYKTLKELTFASPKEKSFASMPRRIPGAFATICWFHELKLDLDVDTLVAVQQAIEPTTEEKAAFSRRWGEYKNGRRNPSDSVVDLADQRIPGSKTIFQLRLWDALRLEKSAVTVAHKLHGATSRAGDELLQRMLDRQRSSKDPRWLHKRCRAMVAHGSLEGLAVLTVCMRLAGSAGASRLALTFYRHATDCLEILGSWFYQHGIALAIAEYYEKKLLPTCCSESEYSTFRSSCYLNSVIVLNKAALAAQAKAGRKLTQEEWISEMLKLFTM